MELPSDTEMEKTLLSAMMLKDGEIIPAVSEIVKADDFYRPEHKLIFAALLKVSGNENGKCDFLLLREELRREGNLNKIDITYLHSIVNMEYTTARAVEYAKQILEHSRRRKLYYLGCELEKEAIRGERSADDLIEHAEKTLQGTTTTATRALEEFSPILIRTFEQMQSREHSGLTGLTTGLIDVNKITQGLKKSDLIILAARPSMGKTALALNIAQAASRAANTAIFSLEMSKEQLAMRFISTAARVDATRITSSVLNQDEWSAVVSAIELLNQSKLFIDDTAAITLTELRNRARRLKQERGLELIIIDYIQLMQGSKELRGNRVQEVSEISRGLKALARELNVPVLALSQLSRQVEMRAEKKPQLSDLRESGSIEQDADIVMFLYRDEYYNHDESEQQNIAELIIAKNRNGKTGTIRLHFDQEIMLFSDLTRREW